MKISIRLKIEHKSQNTKILKETANLSYPRFIGPKTIMHPKIFESKLKWS